MNQYKVTFLEEDSFINADIVAIQDGCLVFSMLHECEHENVQLTEIMIFNQGLWDTCELILDEDLIQSEQDEYDPI